MRYDELHAETRRLIEAYYYCNCAFNVTSGEPVKIILCDYHQGYDDALKRMTDDRNK